MVNYTDNIIPAMTSDSMNGFITTASSSYSSSYLPWRAFNRDPNSYWSCSSSFSTGWIACEFPFPKRIVKFTIRNRIDGSSPKAFSFDAFDGTNWITLFQQTAAETPNWRDGEKREYTFENPNEYKRYRLNITQTQTAGPVPEIREIEMMEELIIEKCILISNNKYYSLNSLKQANINYKTNMTSNTIPTPLVTSASSEFSNNYGAWKAFNGVNSGGDDYWCSTAGTTGWIQINYGRKISVNSVELSAHLTNANIAKGMPKDFNILGSNDGVVFTVLSEIKNQTNWNYAEKREFHFSSTKPYQYYRIQALSENGYGYITIAEILFNFTPKVILEIPNSTKNNFINYGDTTINNLDMTFTEKAYLLQNVNSSGLIEKQLNRKPLSISFK